MADVYNMSDVFLSYSRRDKEMCRRIFDSFKEQGKEVWADFEDIPLTADWWEEIKAGINASEAFVFLISPDSVRSTVCRQEIDHAVDNNKRIIPVLYREIVEDEDKELIHPSIGAHNWVFINDDNYDDGFGALLASVETDLEHNRTMTRLLVRAREWDNSERAMSYLLIGDDLKEAESWLTQAVNKDPKPMDLHYTYITASRQVESNRQRQLLTGVTIALGVAIALAVFALFQWNDARIAREAAEVAQAAAERSATEALSLALAANSGQFLINNDPDIALTLALEAVEVDSSQPQSQLALANAAYAPGTRFRIQHTAGVVNRVAYNSSGTIILTGTNSGFICLTNSQTGEQIACMGDGQNPVHAEEVFGVAFLPGDLQTASLGEAGEIFIWDIDPDSDTYGEALFEYNHDVGLDSLAISPDGEQVLFGDADGAIGILAWQNSAEPAYLPQHHNSAVTAIAVSPSGELALTGGADGTVYLWDMESRLLLHTEPALHFVNGGGAGVMGFDFNEAETEAVSSGRDDLIIRWNLLEPGIVRRYEGHNDPVTHAVFVPGNMILSSSWDNSIKLWDIETGAVIREFFGHTGGVNDLALHPDRETFVTGSFDTDLRIWTLNSFLINQRLVDFLPAIEKVAVSQDASFVVTAHDEGSVMLWDLTGERDDSVLPQNTDNTNNSDVPPPRRNPNEPLANPIIRHTGTATDVAISPDGTLVVSIGTDDVLHVSNIENKRRQWGISNLDGGTPRALQFDETGDILYVALSNEIRWYEAATGDLINNLLIERSIRAFAVNHDGTQALIGYSGSSDNLHLIDLETGNVIYNLDGHTDGVLSVNFNSDSTQAVSGSFDNTVLVWDLTDGEEIREFRGHSDRILSVAFNPLDSDHVLSASNDRTLRMWSIETGYEIVRFEGHADRVTDATFTTDGEHIFSVSEDRSVIEWRLPHEIDGRVEWALSNRYVPSLSCFERELFRVEPLCEDKSETVQTE